MKTLENSQIYLDKPIYRPGDFIHGNIQIRLNSTKVVSGIFIKISGKATVHWSENHSADSSTYNYSNKEKLFLGQINVLGTRTSNSRVELPAGQHVFPFKYLLPRHLPSSFRGRHGKIKYKVKVILDCPWKINKCIKVPFFVETSNIQEHPQARKPGVLVMSKKFGIFFTSKPLTTIIRTPHSGFDAGQKIPLTFDITNHSNTAVNRISVKLKQKITYHAKGKDSIQTKTLSKNVINYKIKPNTSTTINHSLQVPANVILHDLSNCKIIDNDYEIKVKIITAGMSSNLIGMMPIYPVKNTFMNFDR